MNIPFELRRVANELELLSIEIGGKIKDLPEEDRADAQALSDKLFKYQSDLRTSMYWLSDAMFGEE